MKEYDYVIIGAGIIGAATAYTLARRFPASRILILEKESTPGTHQTGRNSGVIHAGVYYAPGSLKARFCQQGLHDTLQLCRDHNLPHQQCGKLVVATSEVESARLETLFGRCVENGLDPQMLSPKQLLAMEPNITGQAAIWVKQTGITDYFTVTRCLLALAQRHAKVKLVTGSKVRQINEQGSHVEVYTESAQTTKTYRGAQLVSCAGVYADSVIRAQGLSCNFKIIPFKGEYFRLSARFDEVSERLIYPVPDPAMPFLGVHLTKMIQGFTTVGPNAVLASGREAYNGLVSHPGEWWRTMSYGGLWHLLWRHRVSVIHEMRTSISRDYYARQVQKYCPLVRAKDFEYFRPGIRAQAVTPAGELLQDFSFVETPLCLHVANAPSPAATSALPIASAIVDKLSGSGQEVLC